MNYESHIQSDKPTLIEFSAGWCETSRLMIPVLNEVRDVAGSRVTVLNVNIEEEPALAEQCHVQTVPTIVIFHRGQILWRKNGISSSHEILEHLQLVMN